MYITAGILKIEKIIKSRKKINFIRLSCEILIICKSIMQKYYTKVVDLLKLRDLLLSTTCFSHMTNDFREKCENLFFFLNLSR